MGDYLIGWRHSITDYPEEDSFADLMDFTGTFDEAQCAINHLGPDWQLVGSQPVWTIPGHKVIELVAKED